MKNLSRIMLFIFLVFSCTENKTTENKNSQIHRDKNSELYDSTLSILIEEKNISKRDSSLQSLVNMNTVLKRYRFFLKSIELDRVHSQSEKKFIFKNWYSEQKIALQTLGEYEISNYFINYSKTNSINEQIQLIDSIENKVCKAILKKVTQ